MRARAKKRSKGLIVAAILVIAAIAIAGAGIYYSNFIYRVQTTVEIVKEATIVEAINYVEMLKIGLRNAVGYSVYRASDDVLTLGGICEHSLQSSESGYCTEDCKIPAGTPTFECTPWWKVHDKIYAPTKGEFMEYMTNRTLQNFEGYANMLEVQDLEVPNYCPPLGRDCSGCLTDSECPEGCNGLRETGGVATIESTKSLDPEIKTKMESKNDYLKNEKIEYERDFFTVADNSSFTDTVKATTFSLFDFARDKFIENDYISQVFDQGDEPMPNTWCAMTADNYCDVTSDCRQDTNNCWNGDCCCKGIYYGNVCLDELPNCEAGLDQYCKRDYTGTTCMEADSNCDNTISAKEYYNYTVKGQLSIDEDETDAYGNKFRVKTALDGCIEVGTESTQTYSEIVEVNWYDYDPVADQADCDVITAEGCGCGEYCTASDPECGDCIGITPGIFDGPCPWETLSCPDECCGLEWECIEWEEPGPCEEPEETDIAVEANFQYLVLAESPVCTDSDGGANNLVYGCCEYGTDTYCDYCDGTNVVEYYCSPVINPTHCGSITHGCVGWYGAGATCSGGKCIEPTTTTTTTLPPVCTDSDDCPAIDTDGGYNLYEKGTCSWRICDSDHNCKVTYTQTDSCISSTKVYEMRPGSPVNYCDGETENCPSGTICSDGACVETTTTTTTTTTTLPATCINHNECSQACTDLCPYMVYGCCYGCMLGQCIGGTCQCIEKPTYCSGSPISQVGSQCIVGPVCSDIGLGTPSVSPSTPTAGSTFQISCPVTQVGADCIAAYANDMSSRCNYTHWSGNNAVFNCPGLAAGTYTARCTSQTETPSNCCYDTTTTSYATITPTHDIVVGVTQGSGAVNVAINGIPVQTVTEASTATITFEHGDSASFEAIPSSGYTLESYCGWVTDGEVVCCTPDECPSPLIRPIWESGGLYVNFVASVTCTKHEIRLECRDSICGFPGCCKKAAYMKDVKCEYDYVGTANLSVEVSDMAHKYPIGTETKNLKLPFYIASGNTLEEDLLCGASTTDDDPNTEEVEFPQWQDCKEPYKHEITVSVSSGFGTVDIYRNDEFIGKATEVISFIVQFSSEDIAKFVATPSTGYSFESWCGDDDCCSPPDPECGPTISRTINADGNLYANFESV